MVAIICVFVLAMAMNVVAFRQVVEAVVLRLGTVIDETLRASTIFLLSLVLSFAGILEIATLDVDHGLLVHYSLTSSRAILKIVQTKLTIRTMATDSAAAYSSHSNIPLLLRFAASIPNRALIAMMPVVTASGDDGLIRGNVDRLISIDKRSI